MAKKLRLLASVYDQPQSDDRDPVTERFVQGDVFEPRSDGEADRLIEAGAAEDPDKVNEQARERVNAELERLNAERDQLDARIEAQKPPDELDGSDLDAALNARGLSTKGKVDEKRSRLAAAIAAESPPAP